MRTDPTLTLFAFTVLACVAGAWFLNFWLVPRLCDAPSQRGLPATAPIHNHRGGWLRGYDGPVRHDAGAHRVHEEHEGASMKSPLPKDEVRGVGEDPRLTAQIEIHREVAEEMAEEERKRVEAAHAELAVKEAMDAAFAPIQKEAAGDGWNGARVILARWGFDLDQMTRDAHHRAAVIEEDARALVSGEIIPDERLIRAGARYSATMMEPGEWDTFMDRVANEALAALGA